MWAVNAESINNSSSKLESDYLHIMNAFRVTLANFQCLGSAHKKAGEGL